MCVPDRSVSVLHIGLKSDCKPRHLGTMIKLIQPVMKLPNISLLHCVVVVSALLASPFERATGTATSDQPADPGWPREKYSNGTRLIIYQPQVDDWKNFQ